MDSGPGEDEAKSHGAKRRLSASQWGFALLLAAALIIGSSFNAVFTAKILVCVYLTYIFGFLTLRALAVRLTLRSFDKPQPVPCALSDGDLPQISLLCPLYQEADSIKNLVAAIGALDYPADRVETLLLIESDDQETLEAAASLHGSTADIVKIPAGGLRTKPNALNHGLHHAHGALIGVYDAEDRPEPDQLRQVASAFFEGGARLGCVQARLNYYNRDDTLIARMFALEYALHFDWFLPGLTRMKLPIPLGGTSNFVRKDALRSVGGWDPYNVTEDADLGLRLHAHGWRVEAVSSSTLEEATDNPSTWVKQRARWIKGFMQTFLVHTRHWVGWRHALILHFSLGSVVVSALISPLMAALLGAAFIYDDPFLDAVFAGPLGPLSWLAFLLGNLAHAWMLMMAPVRRDWFELAPSGLLLPIYWTLQSVAGYRALYELVVRPFHWNKTEHSSGHDVLRDGVHG